jgi:hypothetical protein
MSTTLQGIMEHHARPVQLTVDQYLIVNLVEGVVMEYRRASKSKRAYKPPRLCRGADTITIATPKGDFTFAAGELLA